MSETIVVVGMARTPIGGLQGDLAAWSAPELGAITIRAALQQSKLDAYAVDETIMGCVLPAGLGQAPARQASIGGGIPTSCACTTVNKMCGSGMKAVMMGMDAIKAGSAAIVAAGGMESMSNSPYIVPKARSGLRLGHGELLDHMFVDGLEDAYDKGQLMGSFAEACVDKYQFSREALDAFAIESLTRARSAIDNGRFKDEIVAVSMTNQSGEVTITTDEQPGKANIEKISKLNPAFKTNGSITPANSSSISDGAAALIIMSESEAEQRGLTPIARLLAQSVHAQKPAWFTIAPIGAVQKVLAKVGWGSKQVDLYEINEAFAVVTMTAMQDLGLPHDIVNVNGGACALGHPVGASGARIMVTLISALKDRGLKRGIASLCIGGGEATAVALELM